MRPRYMVAAFSVTVAWSLACASGEEAPVEEAPAEPAPEEEVIAGSGTKEDPFQLQCNTRGRDHAGFEGEFFVSCPSDCTSGSVWGSCTYTMDSSICVAAVHAGALESSGGTTKAQKTAGQDSYKGSEQNGVSSSDWGSFGDSFTFARMGGACASDDGGGAKPPRDREQRRPR